MLPLTRADLDYTCCICLLDIRPSVFPQKVYNVRKEPNLLKLLKLTAHITILKNPINLKYINDYCRNICETCLIKVQYFYGLREKILASTITLKELLESNNLKEMDLENLKYFCRICLNRQTSLKDTKLVEIIHVTWMKNCSGIRFTSFVDEEPFRIKEGTNINEIATINDTHFPKHLCRHCFKKLKNFDEFRKSATQFFEYMISVMGDVITQDHLISTEILNHKPNENIKQIESIFFNCIKENGPTAEAHNINENQQECLVKSLSPNLDYYCGMEPPINSKEFTNMQHFETSLDNTCQYSDNSLEGDILNFDESADSIDSSNNENILRKTRTEKSEQKVNILDFTESTDSIDSSNYEQILEEASNGKSKQKNYNKMVFKNSAEGNIETDIRIKVEKPTTRKLPFYTQRQSSNSLRNLKENTDLLKIEFNSTANVNNEKTTLVCEECLKEFSSKPSLRKHKRLVHNFDLTKMLECVTCFKTFKRKCHLTDHIKAVHEKIKPFKCTYCGKTFSTKNSQRVHELSHTGDYPFICNFCGKGFRRSNELKKHLDIHTTVPELLCPICKRSQKSKTDMELHLKKHSDNRLQCPLCGKLFSRNFHLIDHQNAVHFKLRPFKCKFCELAFGDRKTRRSHEKRHGEDGNVKCSICLIGFKTKVGLTRHIKETGHNQLNG